MANLVAILLLVLASTAFTFGLEDLMNTDMTKCINCLCHARTGCYSRFNCAKYSVNFDYWNKAGSPSVDVDELPDRERYENCMMNENCIVNTISKYIDNMGHRDCNCDGEFDCKDMLAVHLFGEECQNPKYGRDIARRFNDCARMIGVDTMLSEEGYAGCEGEVIAQ